MEKLEMTAGMRKKVMKEFDIEARWHGEMTDVERCDIKMWTKKLRDFAVIDMRLGKERSRITMVFDRKKVESSSREQIGVVEAMLRENGEQQEGVNELAAMRQAPIDSASGLLVKDYVEVLARDWAVRASSSLHGLVPGHCALKVSLGPALAAAPGLHQAP